MTEMRRPRGRARRELAVLAACEAEEEQLLAAKDAAATDPSPETLAAKKAAMASFAETRAWLRAKQQIADTEATIRDLATRTDKASVAKRAAAEATLARLHAEFDPLIAAMDELAGGSSPAEASEELPPGSVTVVPAPLRGRARFGKGGA